MRLWCWTSVSRPGSWVTTGWWRSEGLPWTCFGSAGTANRLRGAGWGISCGKKWKRLSNEIVNCFQIIWFAMTTLPTNASLPVVDPLEERSRKKRARTAAWCKCSVWMDRHAWAAFCMKPHLEPLQLPPKPRWCKPFEIGDHGWVLLFYYIDRSSFKNQKNFSAD
jgi:hypothetical protein